MIFKRKESGSVPDFLVLNSVVFWVIIIFYVFIYFLLKLHS